MSRLERLTAALSGRRTLILAAIAVIITGIHEYRPDWISEFLYFHLMAVCGFGSAVTLRWAVANLGKELQAEVQRPPSTPPPQPPKEATP